jgi:hypothetical protein
MRGHKMPSTIRIMQNKAIIFPDIYYIRHYVNSSHRDATDGCNRNRDK